MYGLNEEAAYAKTQETYASSKIAAEQYLLKYMQADSRTIPITILRPGFIYGPNERAWLPKVIESIQSKKAVLIDKGLKQCNLISVDNLVHAIALAINNNSAYNQIFNLTDREYISKAKLFNTIAQVLNLPPIEKSISSTLLFPLTEVISTIAPILPSNMQRKLSKFSRASYRLIALNQGFSITKAETLLNYKPEANFEKSIKQYLVPSKELALWSAR
jgi:nucleoside-diphosphate-sugar epimerase